MLLLLAMLACRAIALGADDPPAADGRAGTEAAAEVHPLERDGSEEPMGLQTAIVRFAGTEPGQTDLVVDLIGAVHVGEKAYYEAVEQAVRGLRRRALRVGGTRRHPHSQGIEAGGHPVAMLQNGLKDMLNLEHQLQYIDYTKDNMVHADMSPDDLAKSMSRSQRELHDDVFPHDGARHGPAIGCKQTKELARNSI